LIFEKRRLKKMTNGKAILIFEKMKKLWLDLQKKDKDPHSYTQPDLFDGMDIPK
jgi:hypothetical protein